MTLWRKELGQWVFKVHQFWNLRTLEFTIQLDKGGFFEWTVSLWK